MATLPTASSPASSPLTPWGPLSGALSPPAYLWSDQAARISVPVIPMDALLLEISWDMLGWRDNRLGGAGLTQT